jgi:REP element-mobilizing transposase RayT
VLNHRNADFERMQHVLRKEQRGSPDALTHGIHTRGFLPHVKRRGASYFVTFRLADSLPKEVLLRLAMEKSEKIQGLSGERIPGQDRAEDASAVASPTIRSRIEREYRRQIELYLDRGLGACHLQKPRIAELASGALRFYHEKDYLLEEWVIMPNHVHLLLRPLGDVTLSEILRGRKQFIAKQANKILGQVGIAFWQKESFDHWVRDEDEKYRIRRYIRQNPVKAGLVKAPEQWKWGSALDRETAAM